MREEMQLLIFISTRVEFPVMENINKAIDLCGGPSKMASILGVTPQAVCFWRDGKRKLAAEYCASIEQATNGEVTRRDLRPDDWHLVWPELVTPEYPAPGNEAKQAA